MHERQLEHSVKAVYGEGFAARDYLRRFFTRHYELRRLSIKELVESHFASIPREIAFGAPSVWESGHGAAMVPAELAGRLLSQWGTTPREALAVVEDAGSKAVVGLLT